MYFDTYGPFEVGHADNEVFPNQPNMWADVRMKCTKYGYDERELERSIGCYAFGLRYGDTLRPWYVGMTCAQTGFRGEVFEQHKLNHYNKVLSSQQGSPIMFLMPLLTPDGKFSRDRNTTKPLIEWVEKMLLGVAVSKNPDCRNKRDTRYLRKVVVNGVFGAQGRGRPEEMAVAAREMFG